MLHDALDSRPEARRPVVRSRSRVWAILVAFVLVACGVVWMELWSGYGEERRDTPIAFDSVAWKSARLNWGHWKRWAMVDSLLESRVLIGMTVDEAWEILGPPDVAKWSDPYPHPGYRLGPSTLSRWDSGDRPLLLVIGKDGRIESVVAMR